MSKAQRLRYDILVLQEWSQELREKGERVPPEVVRQIVRKQLMLQEAE